MEEQKIGKSCCNCHSLGGYVALALLETYVIELKNRFDSIRQFDDDEEKKHSRNKNHHLYSKKARSDKFVTAFRPAIFTAFYSSSIEKKID